MLKQSILSVVIIFAASANPSDFQLSGTVTTYHSREPIAICRVLLKPESPTALPDTGITDNNGHYFLSDVSPGVYSVSVANDDYVGIPRRIAVDGSVTADFQLAIKSHVVEGDLPKKLTKDMSPVFILTEMRVLHDLAVEAGVTVYYLHTLTINGPSMTAAGHTSDPIHFIPLDSNINLNLRSRIIKCTNCVFGNGNYIEIFSDSGAQSASFDSCQISVKYMQANTTILSMRHCSFQGGFLPLYSDSIIFIENNLAAINPNFSTGVEMAIKSHGLIKDNTLPYASFLLESSGDTIINNIISSMYINLPYECSIYLAFNCIQNYESLTAFPPGLMGIGKTILKNDNGTPCDLFFNIFTDPMIQDSTTGRLAYQSPCFRAGLNGRNIGVWKEEPGNTNYARNGKRPVGRNSSLENKFKLMMPGISNGYYSAARTSSATVSFQKAAIYQINGRRAPNTKTVCGNSGNQLSRGIYILGQQIR